MELYNYDFSEFEDNDVNEFGLFGYEYIDHYWTENGRYPFIIKVNENIAGFALIREVGIKEERGHTIAEFFILKKYRRKSIGKKAAFYIFNMFPGKWKIAQIEENIPAQNFWLKIIKEYTNGEFHEIREEDWHGPKQVFISKGSLHL